MADPISKRAVCDGVLCTFVLTHGTAVNLIEGAGRTTLQEKSAIGYLCKAV